MLVIERRQWAFVIGLIALTVAIGVFIVTAGFNVSSSAERAYGNGTHMLFGPAAALPKAESLAAESFTAADVVRLAEAYPIGSATPVNIKSLDPEGPNVAPLIALLDGRYPAGAAELAATPRELARLGLDLGDSVELLDVSYSIVGVVENPEFLDDDFFLAAPRMERFEAFEMLVTGTEAEVDAFGRSVDRIGRVEVSDDAGATTVLLLTLVIAALLEVALLSIAVLTVLAQRRVRQLGVLAALGAGRRQVRAAVVAGGVAAGAVAVATGVVIGIGASLLAVPRLDNLAARRIDSVDFPWIVLAVLALVAFGAAVGAAWWPARKMATLTVAGSLRARRPAAVWPVKMTVAGMVLVIAGVASLLAVFSMSPADRPIFLDVAAFIAIPVGAVLLAPAAVRLWVRLVPKPGLVARVAMSDVGRYQSRSAATAAALVIIFTIPVVAAVGFRTVEQSPSNVPTMAKNTVVITSGFAGSGGFSGFGSEFEDITDRDDLSAFSADVQALADQVGARSVPLIQPVQVVEDAVLGVEGPETTLEFPLMAGIVDSQQGRDFTLETVPTYVASSELFEALGLDRAVLDGHDVVTNRPGRFALVRDGGPDPILEDDLAVRVADFARYSQTPGALLSPDYVAAAGLPTQVSGWLLIRNDDFTPDELAGLRFEAGRIGLGAAVHEPGLRGGTIVTWMVIIAALLATGIAAIVGALHRAETAEVDVAYQSVGASASFRRRVHGVTIAALVLVAAVLATGAGLLSQVGFAKEQLGAAALWKMVPPVPLLVVLVVIPIMAFGVNWLGTATDRDTALPQRQFG